MYPGMTATKFGRIQSAPPLQLHRLHVPGPALQLREVEHQVPIPVLAQEGLIAQGIDTSMIVPGAQKADALGSCTANAGTAHLAERWATAGKNLADISFEGRNIGAWGLDQDPAACEMFAIQLYHLVTDQTGDPATEWPPSDYGSSGYYVCAELERLGLATSYKTASGITGVLSLLQSGTVMQGFPWFFAWEHPDASGFIDGDGSPEALTAAVESGVAGGHETLLTGIAQLAITAAGTVDLADTVLRARNSWGPQWGPLGGDYLVHASTLGYLSAYADYKAIVI